MPINARNESNPFASLPLGKRRYEQSLKFTTCGAASGGHALVEDEREAGETAAAPGLEEGELPALPACALLDSDAGWTPALPGSALPEGSFTVTSITCPCLGATEETTTSARAAEVVNSKNSDANARLQKFNLLKIML